jgi:PHS family inorganic phosphate transporter-like MFS transporter
MTILWQNLKFLAIAGVGLFGDGYLNISIGLVVPMIGYLYFVDEDNAVPTVPSDVIRGGLSVRSSCPRVSICNNV